MKFLNQYLNFDFDSFMAEKSFQVTGIRNWSDYDTGECLGKIVDTVIARDNTPYKQKDGEHATNLFEKVAFKVSKKDVAVEIGGLVMPVNPVATVYGQYRNQLSVKCEDIQVVTNNRATAPIERAKAPLRKDV